MAAVPSTHPGEELLEILNELNISAEAFAQATGMSADLVNRIVEAQASHHAGYSQKSGKGTGYDA